MSSNCRGDGRLAFGWDALFQPRRKHKLTLIERRLITKRVLRVTLGGFGLEGFRYQGGDQRCTLLIPWPEEEAWRYIAPMPTDPWSVATHWGFAAALSRPLRRRLTVSGYRSHALEIDFDILIHGESPLGTWAGGAPLGSVVDVIDNGRRYHVPTQTRWQLLIADEAGASAALAVAAETPPSVPTTLYVPRVEVAAAEQGPGDHVSVISVPMGGEQRASGEEFAASVLAGGLPRVPDLVGIAGERSFAHTLVTRLRRAGVPRGAIHAGSYWKHQ
ncbi:MULTISPECIES: siderophore-interacting protein [Microbacterium]|jgi:NADPH-dependent ferric siderophore reductase|uniref:Siderophore-interacting protein n=1 Tax=Microbacterium galbinum TaxID=2851646 RepID=A0ABY4IPP7_9MICO|nr:siderophore-interacting protein [Microbacterium galbinum]